MPVYSSRIISHLGHGADGAQSLPSEAVRLQSLQVLVAADLGCEMSHGHHRSICSFDSTAVITHFYPVQTVVLLESDIQYALWTDCATGREITQRSSNLFWIPSEINQHLFFMMTEFWFLLLLKTPLWLKPVNTIYWGKSSPSYIICESVMFFKNISKHPSLHPLDTLPVWRQRWTPQHPGSFPSALSRHWPRRWWPGSWTAAAPYQEAAASSRQVPAEENWL